MASQECEKTSVIDISDELTYKLPEGFKIHSLADGYDLRKLDRCTYRGFGNGDEPPEQLPEAYKNFEGPNFDESHKIYVEAPNGDYAAYCGMWYDKDTNYAYVEPVCTDPLYRKMGCAKAAVLEAALRCGKLGISNFKFLCCLPLYGLTALCFWIIYQFNINVDIFSTYIIQIFYTFVYYFFGIL